MKNRAVKPLSLITFFSILLFGSIANAVPVTFDIISGPQFVNQFPVGVGNTWTGSDGSLPALFPGEVGLNTVGSSASSTSFSGGEVFSTAYQVGNSIYNNPITFGVNQISSISRQNEIFGVADGLAPGFQTLSSAGPSFTTNNRNGTTDFTSFSEDPDFDYFSQSTAGYYITAGQNPDDVFAEVGLFDGRSEFQQGVIDQFNFFTSFLPDWTLISFYLFNFEGAAKTSEFQDIEGRGYASFVSFDEGAIPQEVTSVPEPSTYMLLSLGMLGLIGFSRKKVRVS